MFSMLKDDCLVYVKDWFVVLYCVDQRRGCAYRLVARNSYFLMSYRCILIYVGNGAELFRCLRGERQVVETE